MEELKSFSDGSNCLMDNRIVVNANLSEMKGEIMFCMLKMVYL